MQQIAIDEQHREAVVNSRSIFVTAVEDEERIRFPEEVLLIQLITTELQHHRLLKGKQAKRKAIWHLLCRDADHSSCGYDKKHHKPMSGVSVSKFKSQLTLVLLLRQHQ